MCVPLNRTRQTFRHDLHDSFLTARKHYKVSGKGETRDKWRVGIGHGVQEK